MTRYSRQMILTEIGEAGQQKLATAHGLLTAKELAARLRPGQGRPGGAALEHAAGAGARS